MIDVRWQDKAFVSTGDGVGYNLVHERGLQVGIGMAYDLGRKERADYLDLRGMGDQSLSAAPKGFVTWVVSERFPMVVRADWRHLLRSGGGSIGDVGAYLPMPGSSSRFVYFLGPSITIANRRYLRDSFGVTSMQSIASDHPGYLIQHSGVEAYRVGLTADWRFADHYLLNASSAANHLGHSAIDSPIVERASSHAIAISIDYQF